MYHFTIAEYQHTVNDFMCDNIDVSITNCICDNICHITEQKPFLHTTNVKRHITKISLNEQYNMSYKLQQDIP